MRERAKCGTESMLSVCESYALEEAKHERELNMREREPSMRER